MDFSLFAIKSEEFRNNQHNNLCSFDYFVCTQVQRLVVVGSGAGSPIMSQPTNPISYAGLVTQPLSPYVKRRGQGDGGGGGAPPLNGPSTWQPPVTLRGTGKSMPLRRRCAKGGCLLYL